MIKISEAKFAGSSTDVSGRPQPPLPEFAFIGRSNVGKSSLINMLCANGKLALTSSTPGKTVLVNHFRINGKWYLVDLPGYGYAKAPQKERQRIYGVINNYILNSPDLVQLFVLIDSRHDIQKIDIDFLSRLGEEGIPFSIIYTKCDKQGPNVLAKQMEKNREILSETWEVMPHELTSSSRTGKGREEILSYIGSVLSSLKDGGKEEKEGKSSEK